MRIGDVRVELGRRARRQRLPLPFLKFRRGAEGSPGSWPGLLRSRRLGWCSRVTWFVLQRHSLSRFPVELPPGVRLPAGAAACPTVSPDGRYIAFVGISEDISRVFLRPTAVLSAQPIPGTEDAGECPFWSPDSRFIGFFAGGKVKKVAVSAGTPVPLCDATAQGNSGVWNATGVILFAHQGSVHRVDAGGGRCMPIRTPDKSRSELSHSPMSFLPDGQHFLYVSRTSDLVARTPAFKGELRVGSLDSSNDTPLLPVSSRVTYSHSGHLLFVRDGMLIAQPFDARGLSLRGDIVRVAEGIAVLVKR